MIFFIFFYLVFLFFIALFIFYSLGDELVFELDRNDFLSVFSALSNMMRIWGLTLLIPLIVSLAYNDTDHAIFFAITGLIFLVFFTLTKRKLILKKVQLKHTIIAIALGWILITIISALPFLLYGLTPWDSLFESSSGLTGTGISMIQDPALLPNALNFWRAFTQWIGGFGIVLLALLVFERPSTARGLFNAEGRNEEFFSSASKIARAIIAIYLVYTVVGVILFQVTGMSLFDAVFHSLTTISTGGFSTTSAGLGSFGFPAMAVGIILMLLGGISFTSHYKLITGRIKEFFSNPETKFLFLIVIVATLIELVALFYLGFDNISKILVSIFEMFFYSVSAITGTGANAITMPLALPQTALFSLILLMLFGACYGSTSGAIKLWRILILYKVIKREIHKAFLPQGSVANIKVGEKTITDEDALKALSYIALYLCVVALGSLALMFGGYSLIESIFTSASAQGNVGLSMVDGINWFGMNPILKIILSIQMLVGRMEIIPFLVLLKSTGIGNKIN
jgi:trk system potassium uptake protein TrkH